MSESLIHCARCEDKGEVAATPGQPGDGPMPCPDCGPPLTFGECEGLCGRMVERVGWDRYCFACQEEMRDEDDERAADLGEEDRFLYGV